MHRVGIMLATVAALSGTAAAKPKAPKAPKPVACPAAGALPGKLRTAWKLGKGRKVETVVCTSGTFGVPGWAATAWVRGPGADLFVRRAVIDARGKLLADLESGMLAPVTQKETRVVKLEAADLEDDGNQELVEVVHVEKGGYITDTLNVYRVASGKLTQVFTKQLSYDNGGAVITDQSVTCSGTYTLAAPPGQHVRIVVSGVITHRPAAQPGDWADCVNGSESYGMQDGKLVRAN